MTSSVLFYPVCLAGKRACPPDDCGGPWGYGNLLAAISDPTSEEHEELIEWLPPGFYAEEFDIAQATEMMRPQRGKPLEDVAAEVVEHLTIQPVPIQTDPIPGTSTG